jgi:hypothetical protein
MKTLEAHRLTVGDKMHLVALTGECHAELCGYYAATSISRVTYYTYFHIVILEQK